MCSFEKVLIENLKQLIEQYFLSFAFKMPCQARLPCHHIKRLNFPESKS